MAGSPPGLRRHSGAGRRPTIIQLACTGIPRLIEGVQEIYMNMRTTSEFVNEEPAISLVKLTLFLLAILAGSIVATMLLPALIPGLAATAVGDQPTIYWMLSRGTAIVGFGLLWMSAVMGLIITNRMARLWPGGPAAFDLHQYFSILGMAFALLHGTLLLGDRYMNFSLLQVIVPFTTQSYRPIWVDRK